MPTKAPEQFRCHVSSYEQQLHSGTQRNKTLCGHMLGMSLQQPAYSATCANWQNTGTNTKGSCFADVNEMAKRSENSSFYIIQRSKMDLHIREKIVPTSTTLTNTQMHFEHSYQISLWIVTLRTQHKLANESIQHVLQFVCLMRPVDNVAVVLCIKLGLGSQLTAEELGWI